uniref:RSE1/DDB1/CPSF1 C-terminal domain-containing protein n=1 Tax=Timema bartmani TaxID=61472 RepID=A0A7R9FB56_9NEOP|nr:unnamed protein product [Timema bartmani]
MIKLPVPHIKESFKPSHLLKTFLNNELGMLCQATLDGGLGYMLPVPEKTYRRLLMLQNVLVNHIAHTAGLNPKSFR